MIDTPKKKFPAWLTIPTLITALVVGLLGGWVLSWSPFSAPNKPANICVLEMEAASAADATLRVQIDDGHGFPGPEGPRSMPRFAHRDTSQPVTVCTLPPRQVASIRVTILETPEFVFRGARLRMLNGVELAHFVATDVRAVTHANVDWNGVELRMRPDPQSGEAYFELPLKAPILIPDGNEPLAGEVGIEIFVVALLCIVLKAVFWRWRETSFVQGCHRHWRELLTKARTYPVLAILAVSILTVALNSFPIVFYGESLVSPNTLVNLLYAAQPTVPGAPLEREEDTEGTDVAAMMWAHFPYSAVESRAILKDHEIPLWNRFNATGVSLLGQGQSMLGDPLHWVTILTGAAWWAWDLKFILAKVLFAFGIGLCVRSLTRGLAIPLLMAASSVWIGFFCYRFNHPAIFSFCYAPWILLGWLRLGDATTRRSTIGWMSILLLAQIAELNSGTAKESAMLLVWMNATGLLILALGDGPWREKGLRIAVGLWTGFLFVLLSAPFWLVFLDVLRRSANIYDDMPPVQMPPGFLLGFFDELFSQDYSLLEIHTNPSANFLILAGTLWFLASRRPNMERAERVGRAIVLALAVPLALVFGVVPPGWIKAVPILGSIEHIHNTFGCVVVIQFAVLAGIGLQRCISDDHRARWTAGWRMSAMLLAVAFAGYLGLTQAQGPTPLFARPHAHARSYFFTWYAVVLGLAVVLVPWALRWLRSERRRYEGVLCLAICLFVLHFRHGMYLETKFDHYVMNPRTGSDLIARSPAVEHVKQGLTEPYRVCGFGGNLIPGFAGALGLESFAGPDALMNPWYRELYFASRIHIEGQQWQLRAEEATLPQLKPIYDLLNIGYYLRMPNQGPALEPYLTLLGHSDMEVFRSKEAWPRAFFTDKVFHYQALGAFLKAVTEGDGHPFAAVQDAPGAPKVQVSPDRQVVPARDYHLTNNTTSFSIAAPGPGIVVLGEAYEEGNFRVLVNGKPADYFRVNHAFKGVRLESAGNYQISFSYWPKYLTPALFLCGFGLVLLAGTVVFFIRSKRNRPWQNGNAALSGEVADAVNEEREKSEATLAN